MFLPQINGVTKTSVADDNDDGEDDDDESETFSIF